MIGTQAQRKRKQATLKRGELRAISERGVVAEGDSWFNYVVQPDIVDLLIDKHKIPLKSVAKPGDLLINMVYGMQVNDRSLNLNKSYRRKPKTKQPLHETLKTIKKYKPRVFLFSGGGNDVAGPELLSYLNHAAVGGTPVKWNFLKDTIQNTYAQAYTDLYDAVKSVKPDIHFVTHGYAYPVPDGRPVEILGGLWDVSGPWLKPSFHAMGHTDLATNYKTMAKVMDTFNQMLAARAQALPDFHYVNLRKKIPATVATRKKWWKNELHLTQDGFKIAAAEIAKVIQKVLNQTP